MIICNRLYVSIFDMSPDVLKPGITFLDILRHSVDVGIASHTAEELYAIPKPFLDQAEPATYEERLADGHRAGSKRNFMRSVISALAHARLPAGRLELEITETVLMDESDTVLKTLRQLRDLGVRLALDDFGTGYASLGYLRRFPVDKIKIDRSFIREIGNRDTAAIVHAIISLGRELGITVTADGVETEQMDALRREGCVEAQGYLIGVPSTARDVQRLLRSNAALTNSR